MHLVQILLPIKDNAGHPFGDQFFKLVDASLVEAFGGVTAFSRSPAKGRWVNMNREERDDVVVIEVMAERLDRTWWKAFREQLERDMGQSEIVIRALLIDRL